MARVKSIAITALLLFLTILPHTQLPVYAANLNCPAGVECFELEVPLDYSKPTGEKIKIVYALRKASNAKGTIFINPGGPGGSGISYLAAYARLLGPSVYNSYNLVGLDTRGSGRSAPLRCLTNEQEDRLNFFDPFIATIKNYSDYFKQTSILAKTCYAKYGSKLRFYNLDSIVNDYEYLRKHLKADNFNYLGKSFGSAIGLRYTELYPKYAGKVVVDGIIDSNLPLNQRANDHALALERSYDRFISYTSTRKTSLGYSSARVKQSIYSIFTQLKKPRKVSGARYDFDQTLFSASIIASLYQGYRGYDQLVTELLLAQKGEYNALYKKALALVGVDNKGRYSNNVDYAYVITCQSAVGNSAINGGSLNTLPFNENKEGFLSTYVKATFIPCAHFRSTYKPSEGGTKFKNKILIVSNYFDPVTGHENALTVHRRFTNAFFLVNYGDSHTVYKTTSKCVDIEVERYFSTGKILNSICSDTYPDENKYKILMNKQK